MPDAVNWRTEELVARIAAEDLKTHLDEVYQGLREQLGYKRRDLSTSASTIITPDFEYSVSVSLDREDPESSLWEHQVRSISNRSIVESEGFEIVLGSYLDSFEQEFAVPFDVQQFIDLMEERSLPSGWDIDYDADATECTVTSDTFPGTLVVTADGVRITNVPESSPRALIEGLFSAHSQLVAVHRTLALPLNPVVTKAKRK